MGVIMEETVQKLFEEQIDIEQKYEYKSNKIEELSGLCSLLNTNIINEPNKLHLEAKKILKDLNNQIKDLLSEMDELEERLVNIFSKLEKHGVYSI